MLHKTAELETRTIVNKLVENNHFRRVIVNICRTNWFPTPKTKKCFLYPRRSEVQESSAILAPLDGFPSKSLAANHKTALQRSVTVNKAIHTDYKTH